MSWSYKIGRIAGIPVHLHVTFLLLLFFELLSEGVAGALFTVVVFGIVVLHELGHALAARHYKIGTRAITLLPIGGMAQLERMPREPVQELVVALAGPAVNFVLAGLSFGGFMVAVATPGLSFTAPFLLRLLLVNVGLGVFNLIPAFPMDGGRVFRALLGTRFSFPRATSIAATAGRWIAGAFAIAGVLWLPSLLLVAAFVWLAGRAEELAVARASQATRFAYVDANGRIVEVMLREPERV